MDFFNKAKDSIASASKGITQKASTMTGLARVQSRLKEEEKQLDESLRELGRMFYDNYNEDTKAKFPEMAQQIETLYRQISDDKIEMVFLKGKKVCPNCGDELELEVAHCPSCGFNVSDVKGPVRREEAPKAAMFCPGCGNPLAEGAKFCMNCGNRIGE